MPRPVPLGADNVSDLILLNYKGANFVGHKYGPDSTELRITLGEMDRRLTRMLRALEAKFGRRAVCSWRGEVTPLRRHSLAATRGQE